MLYNIKAAKIGYLIDHPNLLNDKMTYIYFIYIFVPLNIITTNNYWILKKGAGHDYTN